ncbi:MAG: Fur family transcriptional regulator [Candidatus Binataceae bacterium]
MHRTLETLCRIGEARTVTPLHDSARYDGNLEPHHHVICVGCLQIRDIEIAGLDQVLERNGPVAGFTPLGCALEIRAICDRCRRLYSARSLKSEASEGRPKRHVPLKDAAHAPPYATGDGEIEYENPQGKQNTSKSQGRLCR